MKLRPPSSGNSEVLRNKPKFPNLNRHDETLRLVHQSHQIKDFNAWAFYFKDNFKPSLS